MDAESAKLLGQLIGGGLATIGVAGSGVGIGIIFGIKKMYITLVNNLIYIGRLKEPGECIACI